MAGEKIKKLPKGKSTVYVSLPRRARSGGQMKTEDRIKASAEKTVHQVLAEGRGTMRLGPHTHVYVGGLIPTTHPEHVIQLFSSCGRIVHTEFICTRGTATLSDKPLAVVPLLPPPGQLQNKVMRQTWMYAIVYFDDASSATRALAKNGATLYGFEDTQCTIRVVTDTSDLEEMHAVYDAYALGRQSGPGFPQARGLEREDTKVDVRLIGRTQFGLVELTRRAQSDDEDDVGSSSSGSSFQSSFRSSAETLRTKAKADRVRWLQSESTVRPGQKEAVGGLMSAFNAGMKALCGISFKLTVM